MKILIVNGFPRSGKDLFCEAAFFHRGLVYPMSTIDEVRGLAKILGWDGKKDEKGRKFLSDLKDAMTEYNDLPREFILKQIKEKCDLLNLQLLMGAHSAIFLVQAREPKEIKRWVEENNAKTLCIYRTGLDKTWGNHADDDVLSYEYDYYLVNSGTIEEWGQKTCEFIDMIRKEEWESHI